MRNTLLTGLLAIGLAAPAYAEGVYVGGGVFNACSEFGDSDKTGAKLFGGYDVSRHFGFEGGYARGPRDKFQLYSEQSNSTYYQRTLTHSMYAAATAAFPIDERFSLVGKLGVSYTRTEHELRLEVPASTFGETWSDTGSYVGAGVRYQASPRFGVTLEVEHHSTTPYHVRKPRTASLNLLYRF